MEDDEIKELKKEVKKISTRLDKLTSFRYNFFLSIVKGLGSVLGASIVATLLIALLAQILKPFNGIPFLQGILDIINDSNSSNSLH